MSKITIYHNPRCGTSRNTLALIRNTGIEPEVIEYLKNTPSKQALADIIAKSPHTVRDIIRAKEAIYQELDLANPKWTDDELLDFMVKHPILINRPIVVVNNETARLCRPCEEVLDILPLHQLKAFNKENGEAVIDENGKRIV